MTEEVLPRRKAIALFIAFALAYFLSALIRAITATIAPTLVQEFQLNSADLGLLAGGYFLGFAAMQLPLGTWLDRHGPRKVVLLFFSAAVAGCIVFAKSSEFAGLLLGRILCGVGVCACLMAPLTAYRRWYPPDQLMRANSWMLMVGAFGMVASTLPVQWLIPRIGWRGIFVVLAAFVIAGMVIIRWQVPAWTSAPDRKGNSPHTEAPNQNVDEQGYTAIWRHPYFIRLAPLGFFNYGGMVALQTLWAGPWMTKVAGYNPEQAASGLFGLNLAMLLAYWLWGLANPWLSRNGWSAETVIRHWMPLHFVLLAIFIIAKEPYVARADVILSMVCVSCTVVALAQPAVGMAFPGRMAGRALSAYNLVIFAGVFAVQWGIGLLADAFKTLGYDSALALRAAFAVWGVTCVAAYLWARKAKAP